MDKAYKILKLAIVILIIGIVLLSGIKIFHQSTMTEANDFVNPTEQEADSSIIPTEKKTEEMKPIVDDAVRYEGLNNQSALAYMEIAIQKNGMLLEYLDRNNQCFLFDIDGDDEQELLLSAFTVDEETNVPYSAYSIYDYENGEMITLAENERLCIQVAGGDSFASVTKSEGRDYLLISDEVWPEGTGSGGPSWYTVTIYNSINEPLIVFRQIREENEAFYINDQPVTKAKMIEELQKYSGLSLENGFIECEHRGYFLHELILHLAESIDIENIPDIKKYCDVG